MIEPEMSMPSTKKCDGCDGATPPYSSYYHSSFFSLFLHWTEDRKRPSQPSHVAGALPKERTMN